MVTKGERTHGAGARLRGKAGTCVSDATTAAIAATAFAPSGPMSFLLKSSSCTLVTVLSRSPLQRTAAPSLPRLLLLTKVLVRDASLTEIDIQCNNIGHDGALAIAQAISEAPSLALKKLTVPNGVERNEHL